MTDDAYTYYLWHIHAFRIGAADVVQTNITPGESGVLRDPSADLIATILRDAGIEGKPQKWECLAYRSSYQADPLSSNWEDQWPVNWRLRIHFERHPHIPKQKHEAIGTHAQSVESSVQPADPAAALPCLVIADFDSSDAAERARTAIAKLAPKSETHVFAITPSIVQLQCELGPFSPQEYMDGIPLVDSVIAACDDGFTSFHERIEELGEALGQEA